MPDRLRIRAAAPAMHETRTDSPRRAQPSFGPPPPNFSENNYLAKAPPTRCALTLFAFGPLD
jgi:hypothetical protein